MNQSMSKGTGELLHAPVFVMSLVIAFSPRLQITPHTTYFQTLLPPNGNFSPDFSICAGEVAPAVPSPPHREVMPMSEDVPLRAMY